MKIVIASDHAGFEAKKNLIKFLEEKGGEIIDLGPDSDDSVDYPKYVKSLVKVVLEQNLPGILICGSGIGVSIVANRFSGIRAALCRTVDEAIISKQHNNANVLCMGGRISSAKDINEMSEAWFYSKFEDGRHQRRIDQFDKLGEQV